MLNTKVELISGIFTEILSIVNGNHDGGTILILVIDTLLLPIIIFGFFICCCARTAYLLRIYSMLYYIFTATEILVTIIAIILFIVNKSSYVNDCINRNKNNGILGKDPVGDCENEFKIVESLLIIVCPLYIIVAIHFALVIAAYAASRKDKERNVSLVLEDSESNISSAH
ncbi:13118_t:CDS:2 [Dentiscutata erythropus]|uniref:13118_t:CDS:1 n=1 Tax=Dentiscutata erythropus TaxID=1348616 RepID=A0A9N9ALV4_9GLOM|nr:13118_t:CDS:2 [Dentiscutata erythropus]